MLTNKSWFLAAAGGALFLGALAFHWYEQEGSSSLAELRFGGRNKPTPEEMAKRFHPGEGPCLRYVFEPTSEEELTRAAEALLEAGFGPKELAGLWSTFLKWQREREAPVHAASEKEERVQAISERLPLHGRFLYWLQREHLDEQRVSDLERSLARGEATLQALPPERREKLRALWEAHFRALTLFSAVPLLELLNHRLTHARIEEGDATLGGEGASADIIREVEGTPRAAP
jgi:hypothetical protein